MAWFASVLSVTASFFVTPFLMFMLCIIFLASIGKSLGVRRLYVKILLMIFEYGRAEVASQSRPLLLYDEGEEEDDGGGGEAEKSVPLAMNGVANGAPPLISRDKLILVPDGSLPSSEEGGRGDANGGDEGGGEERYTLANCLDYVKAGVEAIIEDQVTSRFEAEELKNWNLLTRTNRHYEFISWRLTVIWMFGFVIRYFFLLPLRVLICFIGERDRFRARTFNDELAQVVWMVMATFVVGCVPRGAFKRWLNHWAYTATFRILARSLSVVLTFHNPEYQPRGAGICVANHTTPVDVVILSTESCFSLVMWLTICTALVGYVPEGEFKSWLNKHVSIMCFGVLSSSLSSVYTYHNTENRPKNGICVANHTSPIDALVLMCDNCYSLIGQRHGGFLGILQRALARASPHIWFERSEVKDRSAVANRLKKHVSDPKNPPILIFPEGTCINNTSVMQFKKGSFEVGSVIYPVAIKYDAKFGDAFWNSSKYSMLHYLYMMMSSWAIVCDVWYLPPMYQQEGESAIDFANRVKSVIAKQGGLVDLMWDGQLKRMKPKKEWKEKQQEEFSKRLKID